MSKKETQIIRFPKKYVELLNTLSDEDSGKLIKCLFTFCCDWLDWILLTYYNMMVVDLNNLDKSATNWKSWAEHWVKGWRPEKDWENSQKPPRVTPQVEKKKPLNEEKTREEKTREEKISKEDKISKEKESIIPTEEEATLPKKYVPKEITLEINKCLETIKSYNNWICDWTEKEQRQYWKYLIWKLKKIDTVKSWKYKRLEYLWMLLKVVNENQFHRHKIAWPKKIHYALAELQQIANQTVKQKQKNKMAVLPWI